MKAEKKEEARLERIHTEKSQNLLDIIGLVRSFQRQEGNPDCFRKTEGYCDQTDCYWRQWCLPDIQAMENEGG